MLSGRQRHPSSSANKIPAQQYSTQHNTSKRLLSLSLSLEQRETHPPPGKPLREPNRTEAQQVGGEPTVVGDGDGGGREEEDEEGSEGPEAAVHGRSRVGVVPVAAVALAREARRGGAVLMGSGFLVGFSSWEEEPCPVV